MHWYRLTEDCAVCKQNLEKHFDLVGCVKNVTESQQYIQKATSLLLLPFPAPTDASGSNVGVKAHRAADSRHRRKLPPNSGGAHGPPLPLPSPPFPSPPFPSP